MIFDTKELQSHCILCGENNYVHNEVSLDQPIYKYTSLGNALCILDNTFIVYNRHFFSDRTEIGEYKQRWMKFPYFLPAGASPTQRQAEIWNKHSKQEYLSQFLYVSSWTHDNIENYLMWKAYASKGIGVRIETTLRKMLNARFNNNDCNVFCGNVLYEQARPKYTQHDELFLKTLEYANEKEIRIVIVPNELQFIDDIPIGPNQYKVKLSENIINSVVLSPFMSSKESALLKDALNARYHDLIVKESSLLEI